MNLEDYLETLADGSIDLKIVDLQRLSDPSPEGVRQIAARWADVSVRRRRRILQELIDLGEDSVELDFDRS